MRRALIALALASLLAPAVQAQEGKKALVAKILQLQKPQYEQFGNMLAQAPIQQLFQRASLVLRERVPEDKREATAKAMDVELKAYLNDVGPKLRASSVKHAAEVVGSKLEAGFNEAELKQIIQYLESPVVKRYNQMGAEFPNALGQKVGTENRALIEGRARQLETKLADLLGLKPADAAASKP